MGTQPISLDQRVDRSRVSAFVFLNTISSENPFPRLSLYHLLALYHHSYHPPSVASTMPAATFRFLDLPREIRNKIYRAALCSFEPPPTTFMPPPDADTSMDFMSRVTVAKHAIDTSILLASKQIHREAYDAMVKTNRFVRVTTSWGMPIRSLLNHLCVPVVTENKQSVDRFPGYVLSVSITCPKEVGTELQSPFSLEPSSLMLLSRDMDRFCDILMDGNTYIPEFGSKVSLKIAVAPGSILSSSPYKDSVTEFFTETTQQTLLQPFRSRLRGFEKIKVRGHVSRTIAESVERDISHDTASDPETTLTKYRKAKDEGQRLFREKHFEAACLAWQDAALEIEQLQKGGSWKKLTDKGEASFVSHIAEIYFLMKLNIAHIKIASMQKGELYADILVQDTLSMAMKSMRDDHWMPGFRYRPTEAQKAKLAYRHALFLRLDGSLRNVDAAARTIEVAHKLAPNDAAVARERATILAWRASMT